MQAVRFRVLFCLSLVLAFGTACADVRLPSLFSGHAVLQQGVAVPVWGWAEPGEDVTVTVAGQTKTVKAGADGAWRVTLGALKPGATLTLIVKGKNTLTVQDVLVGEVWLGSGQSNMAMTVNRSKDYEREQAMAAAFPQIRMFTVVVSHPDVKAPVAVRYAWAADPGCNLFNGAGLPASPFRTDTFELPPTVPKK